MARLVEFSARRSLATPGTDSNILDQASRDRNPLLATCHSNPPFTTLPPAASCTSNANNANKLIIVWGDSHADHIFPAISKAATGIATATLQRSFSACPPLRATVVKRRGAVLEDCMQFNEAMLSEIASRATDLSGIVLSARWAAYAGAAMAAKDNIFELTGEGPSQPRGDRIANLQKGLERTLSTLNDLGVKVLLVAPTPEMRHRAPQCLARRSREFCSVSRDEMDRQREPIVSGLHEVASRYPLVRIFDPIEVLCETTRCYPSNERGVIYSDDDHLTLSASKQISTEALESLRWLVERETR
jgi:hypothetical protein